MELSALEKEIEHRTPEEQDRLSALLNTLRAQRKPAYGEELDRRMNAKDGWLSLAELKNKLASDCL